MLAAIRKFAQSWVASLLIVPLTISFLVFGVRDVLHPKFTDAVVQAGSHDISPAAFKREFQILLQQYEQQSGQTITVSDAIGAGYDQQILTEVESQTGLSEYLNRIGIVPADYLVDLEINQAPAFANALGEYDPTLLNQWLGQNGLTAPELKSDIRDDIALRQTVAGLAAGLKTPRIYGALLASYNLEGRSITYFVLDPHAVPLPPMPTDAQLQALINQHAAQLTRPEMRTLSVVRFSPKALVATMPVDEAQVQALYAAAKLTLTQPEKRSLVEFTTADAAKAQTIVTRLKAGESPDSVGKTLGAPPIALTDKAKTDVVDPAIAEPAFAAAPGQVLGPIKSGLAGYAVVEVVKITPAMTPTLEQLRPQLETAAKTRAARDRAYAAVTKYNDAHNAGANLADSARAAGVAPVELGPITAEGHDLQNQAVATATPKLLKEAFSLAQGAESELEDEGGGEYFALRVEKIAPPALPQVAEIRPLLTRAYMQQAVLQRLNAKAADLVQAIHKGQTLEAAAASANVPTKSLPNVSRQALEQSKQLDSAVISDLFAAKKGDLISGQVGGVQVIIARIDGIQPASGGDAAREAVMAADQFNDLLLQDMIAAARTRAVSIVKPEGDLTAARLALGVAADQTSQSSTRPKRGPAL